LGHPLENAVTARLPWGAKRYDAFQKGAPIRPRDPSVKGWRVCALGSTFLRRHDPDQVQGVEARGASSQPGTAAPPVFVG